MHRKRILWHVLYYALTLLLYMAFFYGMSFLLALSGAAGNLGAVIAATYGILFLATPVLIAVLMRFSLLKWYVDPFAAAIIPLFLYFGSVINQMKYGKSLAAAFSAVNQSFCADGGSGWMFLSGLFLFGLTASFSFARKQEQSISYRLLAKLPQHER